MTFREKLQIEHPEEIESVYSGGYLGCPSAYGYEIGCPYCRDSITTEDICTKCWDREIPGTEPTEPNKPAEPTEPTNSSDTFRSAITAAISPVIVNSIYFTPGELDALTDLLDVNFLEIIRNDPDIDGMEWVCNICSAYKKLKATREELDKQTT